MMRTSANSNITQTVGDARWVNVTGDTMTGDLTLSSSDLHLDDDLYFEGTAPVINQPSATSCLSLNGSGNASGTGTGIFNTAITVIKIKFTPYLTKVSGSQFYLCDATSGARYTISIIPGSNLVCVVNTTNVATVAYANWSPSWNEFASNILTLTIDSAGGAGTSVVLNGTTLTAINKNAFTPCNPATFYVGSKYDASAKFTGLIDYLYVYSDAAMTIKTADWDFNNSYVPTSIGPTLSAGGTGNSFVGNLERLTVNYHTTFTGYEAPASVNTDFLFNTGYTRTAGKLLDIQNNTASNLILDYSGHASLGNGTVQTWAATAKSLQLGVSGAIYGWSAANNALGLVQNVYFDGTDFRYVGSSITSAYMSINSGVLYYYAMGSGTAGTIAAAGLKFSIETDGELRLPQGNATGQGILMGGDTEIYRGAANRLDLGSGDSLLINSGTLVVNSTSAAPASVAIFATQGRGTDPTYNAATTIASQTNAAVGNWCRNAIISGSSGVSLLEMGDADDVDIGNFYYSNVSDSFGWVAGTVTVATLITPGQLALPVTGSGAGILLGGDTQIFRGATNRLDLASGDSLNLVSGNLILANNVGYIQSYDSGGTVRNLMRLTSGDIQVIGTTAQIASIQLFPGTSSYMAICNSSGLAVRRGLGVGLTSVPTNFWQRILNPDAFDYVYYYDGVGYTNNTTEAKLSLGTVFNLLVTSGTDYLFCGDAATFTTCYIHLNTAAVGVTLVVEYSTGEGTWAALTVTDNTVNLTATASITWTAPGDWVASTVNGNSAYWIRISSSTAITTTPTAYVVTNSSNHGLSVCVQNGDTNPAFGVYRDQRLYGGGGLAAPRYSMDFVYPQAKLALSGTSQTAGQLVGIVLTHVGTTTTQHKTLICSSALNSWGKGHFYICVDTAADGGNAGTGDAKLLINGNTGDTTIYKNLTIGDGTAATDFTLTFDGETNDGILTWMEDEARLDFDKHFALKADSNKLYFGTGYDLSVYYDGTSGYVKTNEVAASDLHLTTGSAKTFVLDTGVYKDTNIAGVLLSKPAVSYPGTDTFRTSTPTDTGIETYAFAVDEKVHGGLELQHDYKEGTDLIFHVHYQIIDAPTGTDNVQWSLAYVIFRDGVTLTTTTTIDSADTAVDTRYRSYRTDFGAITGTNFKIGDQFMFTLTRVAADGDAFAGECLIETAGIHYQCDTIGSREVTTK